MVSPRTALSVESPEGSRWDLAFECVESGEAAVGLGNLTLRSDPATPKAGRRLRIEFACSARPCALHENPVVSSSHAVGRHPYSWKMPAAWSTPVCEKDSRLRAALAADSCGLRVPCTTQGRGTLLGATARRSGPLDWKSYPARTCPRVRDLPVSACLDRVMLDPQHPTRHTLARVQTQAAEPGCIRGVSGRPRGDVAADMAALADAFVSCGARPEEGHHFDYASENAAHSTRWWASSSKVSQAMT